MAEKADSKSSADISGESQGGTLQLKFELPAESPAVTTVLMVCFGVFSGISFAIFTLPYALIFTFFYIACAAIWCAPFCYEFDSSGVMVTRYGRSRRLLWKDYAFFTATRGCLIFWSQETGKSGIRKRPRVLRIGRSLEEAASFAERYLRRG